MRHRRILTRVTFRLYVEDADVVADKVIRRRSELYPRDQAI